MISVAICVACLLTVNWLGRRYFPRPYYAKKLDNLDHAWSRPDTILLGNSTLEHCSNLPAMEQGAASGGLKMVPLMAAAWFTDDSEHALLFDHVLNEYPGWRTLVIGFRDEQLTTHWSRSPLELQLNQRVGLDSRIPLAEVRSVYGYSWLEMLEVRVLRRFYLARARSDAWHLVAQLRQAMIDLGLPWDPYRQGEPTGTAEFDMALNRFVRDPTRLTPSYERVVTEAQQQHMRIVLVAMPMAPGHWQLRYSRPSWQRYLRALEALSQRRGFAVIDATHWFSSPGDFEDLQHMSCGTASKFSWRLGRQLATMQAAAASSP